MIKKFGVLGEVDKLVERIEGIFGKKTVEKFLDKRKGLGRSRKVKIAQYAWKKPESTKRRVKRINKALDIAPYAATGAGTLAIASMLSGNNKENKS
jgi:predicted HAD superfamily phosphohydrolase|tara:strand:+ start:669 stop:956 length:288 start_codon:yes stop_codon:yes gene_type:complete